MGDSERELLYDENSADAYSGVTEKKWSLHVLHGGQTITYSLRRERPLIVGRAPDVDVRIDEPSVSRRHLSLAIARGGEHPAFLARDLGSKSGVKLGELELAPGEESLVQPGTVIELGSALLIFQQAYRSESSPHSQRRGR